MITRIGLLGKKDTLNIEQFQDYWKNDHSELVKKVVPNIQKYVQNHVIKQIYIDSLHFKKYEDVFGISQLWFEDSDSMSNMIDEGIYRILGEDEAKFLKQISLLSIEQTSIKDSVQIDFQKNEKTIALLALHEVEENELKKIEKLIKALTDSPSNKIIVGKVVTQNLKRITPVEYVETKLNLILEIWLEPNEQPEDLLKLIQQFAKVEYFVSVVENTIIE